MDPTLDNQLPSSSSSYLPATSQEDASSALVEVPLKTEPEAHHGGHFYYNFFRNSDFPLSFSSMAECYISSDEDESSYQFPMDFQNSQPSQASSSSNLALGYEGDSAALGFDMLIPQPSGKRVPKRSGDLVRVSGLSENELVYSRDVVRRTRMLFDALRIFVTAHEERFLKPGNEFNDAMARDSPLPVRRPRVRAHLVASRIMRVNNLWINRDKRIVGDIPGIEIGDIFFYRLELCVVGLHGQSQAGIDYLPSVQSSSGQPIATSIIVSGGYEDDEDSGDILIYTGHGGQDKLSKQCIDQKLEGGNLALERSLFYKIEVRVIRGIKYEGSLTSKIYVYDGLYRITEYWFEKGKSGFGVYKFKLHRIEGQPEMGSQRLKFAQTLRSRFQEVRPKGYINFDLSQKSECLPILVFNDIDELQHPLKYGYLKNTVCPPFVTSNTTLQGCDCVSTCKASCYCSKRNGGNLPYDQNGFLLRGKPVIFECGPRCKCSSSCLNRATQKGLRKRLEVYRSPDTLWGVRSFDLIEAGSFICEYTGIVLANEQYEAASINGGDIVFPNRFAANWFDWGDLSKVVPNYQHYPLPPPLEFAMDVSRMRNVACYFSHSAFPNVFVQRVLYDHDNMAFPHLMLFALENIPPMKDLCLDYGAFDDHSEEWTEAKQESLFLSY